MDKAKMQELGKKLGKSAAEGFAEAILEESKNRCPVDTGNLKNSGYVKESEKGFEVGFSAPYAQYVDKMPQMYFNRAGHGGKAHFFTGVVQEAMQGTVLKGEYS